MAFLNHPQPDVDVIKTCLQAFGHIITNFLDEEVLTDASWGLSYSHGPDESVRLVATSGFVNEMILFLYHRSVNIKTAILSIIRNCVISDEYFAQTAANEDLIIYFTILLGSTKKEIRREVCWIIAMVLETNETHIQACH